MQCWQCGVSIKPGQKLCVYCGAKLTQEGEPAYDAPAERSGSSGRDRSGGEREPRRAPGGGGSRGGRAPEDDGWSAEPGYGARSSRSGARELGQDAYYRPDEAEEGGRGDGRSSRQSSSARSSSREEPRSRNPMDDPRAPRNLRETPSGGRSSGRAHGSDEGRGYDDAEYEYDDYNPRDRANPRYQPRFDPDSAEYDAVADQRRQSRVHPRQSESWSSGTDRDGGSGRGRSGAGAGDWDDPRAGRNPRDGRREEYGRGQRGATPDPRNGRYGHERSGGYAGYSESAEYQALYDERSGQRDRGSSAARGGGWNQYESRNAGGFNAPTMGGPNTQGWNSGAWEPGADPSSWAPPGAGFAPVGAPAQAKTRTRGGLIAALVSLVVVVLLGGGFLARGGILSLLHRGGGSAPPAPSAFATYTPGPTPTTLPNYKLNVSTSSKYVIEYPTAWSIQNQNNTGSSYDYADVYQQPNASASIVVETAAAFANLSNDAMIQGEVSSAKQGGFTYTQVGGDVTVSIGGESWTRRDYNVKASNGTALHQAIFATHHAGRGYAIVLTSSASDFVTEDAGIFKTMLGTFRFTS